MIDTVEPNSFNFFNTSSKQLRKTNIRFRSFMNDECYEKVVVYGDQSHKNLLWVLVVVFLLFCVYVMEWDA